MARWTQLKFEMGGAPPRGSSTEKMVNFHPAIIKLRMHENGVFLVPVKYTLVCRAPTLAVLGCTTHCRVHSISVCVCSIRVIEQSSVYA